MKQMKKRWCRWARVTGVAAVFMMMLAEGLRGAAGIAFMLLGLASAGILVWIMRHHLRCPACGSPVHFWKNYEENKFCSACGTQFAWADTWQEKED